jgi:hypothetical protein
LLENQISKANPSQAANCHSVGGQNPGTQVPFLPEASALFELAIGIRMAGSLVLLQAVRRLNT